MKKLNNKGFSLVELIIVIAIMVILVAVLAPQFTKWVERSRVSTDIQSASELATAIEVALAEGKTLTSGTVADADCGSGKTFDSLAKAPVTKATINGGKGQSFSYTVSDGVITITVNSKQIYPTPDATTYGNYID